MKPIANDSTVGILLIAVVGIFVFSDWFGVMPFYARALSVLGMVVHILFAVGVARDAAQRHDDKRLHFVDPLTWGVAVGVFGLVGVALYWLLHLSNLRNDL